MIYVFLQNLNIPHHSRTLKKTTADLDVSDKQEDYQINELRSCILSRSMVHWQSDE